MLRLTAHFGRHMVSVYAYLLSWMRKFGLDILILLCCAQYIQNVIPTNINNQLHRNTGELEG